MWEESIVSRVLWDLDDNEGEGKSNAEEADDGARVARGGPPVGVEVTRGSRGAQFAHHAKIGSGHEHLHTRSADIIVQSKALIVYLRFTIGSMGYDTAVRVGLRLLARQHVDQSLICFEAGPVLARYIPCRLSIAARIRQERQERWTGNGEGGTTRLRNELHLKLQPYL